MKKLRLALIALIISQIAYAGEGMWIPSLLKKLNENDMHAKGLKLSAEDIYSINNSSLKDAIVHFGGGCTSEIISSDGLLLTNHHCGYGRIQSHSSVEHDYLTDGFWAKNLTEELPNQGLTATIIKRIEDVTQEVLEGVKPGMKESERKALVDKNSKLVVEKYTKDSHYKGYVKPFFYGNDYYLFITEVFTDVRLVGAPPSSIGKYGFDTDNWIWPRHTGDFSLFRIYANKDNKPAAYAEDNVPYKPNHFLPINLNKVDENDFTMVYGFPGTTQEYLTSYAVEMLQEVSYPVRIAIRTAKLNVLDKAMASDAGIRIKYAAKQSSTSNAWKKWQGERRGLKKYNAIQRKKDLEARFNEKVNADKTFKQYQTLLTDFKENYAKLKELQIARDYFVETSYFGSGITRYAAGFRSLIEKTSKGDTPDSTEIKRLIGVTGRFFKNYDRDTEEKLFVAMMDSYKTSMDHPFKPSQLNNLDAGGMFSKTVFTDQDKVVALLENWGEESVNTVMNDPLFDLSKGLFDNYFNNIRPAYQEVQNNINELTRLYMKGLMEVLPDDKKYYPDANGTLRVAYGKVEPYEPKDGVVYKYYTTLEGVIEKYNPDVMEFDLPEKLIELYENKDYGQYANDGELRICFIASNHTTGGNSGSPVLNGNGELIGLNFDRNWEGTMSDIMYDPSQCRNIAVDINYVLFIIDKFADCGYLLKNMDIKKAAN